MDIKLHWWLVMIWILSSLKSNHIYSTGLSEPFSNVLIINIYSKKTAELQQNNISYQTIFIHCATKHLPGCCILQHAFSLLEGFCTKHQLLRQHFHYMHVPPLIKAHQLSVLLTGQKNKSRHTGSMFCYTTQTSAVDIRAKSSVRSFELKMGLTSKGITWFSCMFS